MAAQPLPISPLQLDTLTRDYYAHYDAYAIAQLAPLAYESCYKPKFYKAPGTAQEVLAANSYTEYGLTITPGSLIFGFYLPALLSTDAAPQYNLQITDMNMRPPRRFFGAPIPSFFLANGKPTYLQTLTFPSAGSAGAFPNLLNSPYPVIGTGSFLFEFWETSGSQQRVELVIGVLEVVG